jgi:antitoxin (DNA-binding transcriptional repressor) of toxin-antitoxin stability system
MIMFKVNIHEAKVYLSRYLKQVLQGETIILCNRNVPVAEIRPLSSQRHPHDRRIGLAKGEFTVPKKFFDPLPKDVEKLFTKPS